MTEDHIARQLQSQEQRLQALEKWKVDQQISSATRNERDKHLDERFDKLEAAVSEVKGYLLRVVWIVFAGILGAFVTFVIAGGLSNVPTP